jgi:hypothetical protein
VIIDVRENTLEISAARRRRNVAVVGEKLYAIWSAAYTDLPA